MKKSLIALAALASVAGVAQAQSSVSLYGTLDVGVITMNHGNNGDSNTASTFSDLPGQKNTARVTGMASSNLTPSKWGIKGLEDMGGGYKASFTLESALNINTGNNPNGRLNDSLPSSGTAYNNGEGSIQGQMFDREASVGLEGGFGSIKAGRMTTVMADTVGAYDPLGASYAASPLGFNGGYSGAGFTGEGRWDNSLKYAKSFGAFNFNAGYKTAGTTGGVKQGQAYATALEYAQSDWSVKVGYAANKDAIIAASGATAICAAGSGVSCATGYVGSVSGTPAAVVAGANVNNPALALTFADTNALTIAGKYVLGSLTFKGGWEMITAKNPSHASYDTVSNYPQLNGIPVASVNAGAYTTPRTQRMTWLGVNYQATPKVVLSAAAYQLDTAAYSGYSATMTTAGTGTSTAYTASKENVYGVTATYALSNRTKLYATGMDARMSGSVWAGIPNMTTFSVGAVHSF